MTKTKYTDFGFEQIPDSEKEQRVKNVFSSVANRYDLMNDLMSFGLHRIWKKFAIAACNLKAKQSILDLAGGTGDLSKLIIEKIGEAEANLCLVDINIDMINEARKRLLNAGIIEPLQYIQANAESLPFPKNYFDCIVIGFGLRNVTSKERALQAMYNTLKPGGRLVVLEFSQPTLQSFKKLYDLYSFKILPALGKLIVQDAESYKYLVESIRKHPDPNTLSNMLYEAGFEEVSYRTLTLGVVAIHKGFKF